MTGEKPWQEKACLGEMIDGGVRELEACPAFGQALLQHADIGIVESESKVRLSSMTAEYLST